MNMKNTVILLLFLLTVLGLILGIYYTEDFNGSKSDNNDFNTVKHNTKNAENLISPLKNNNSNYQNTT